EHLAPGGSLGLDVAPRQLAQRTHRAAVVGRQFPLFPRQPLAQILRLVVAEDTFADDEVETLHCRPRVRPFDALQDGEVLPEIRHVSTDEETAALLWHVIARQGFRWVGDLSGEFEFASLFRS